MERKARFEDSNIVEREVIRLISFALAGYMILSSLHIIWILTRPEVQEAMNTLTNQIAGYSMATIPLVIGGVLLYGKIRRHIKPIMRSLFVIYVYSFALAAFMAIAYHFMMITIVGNVLIGCVALILWLYYKQRKHDADFFPLV